MCNTGYDAIRFQIQVFGIEFFEMFCCAKVGPVTVDKMSTVGPKIIFKKELEEEQLSVIR